METYNIVLENTEGNFISIPKYYALFPKGAIVMWTKEEIPDGWDICDGEDGRPDLRGRFVAGHDPNDEDFNQIGKTGGKVDTVNVSDTHSHPYLDTLFTENLQWFLENKSFRDKMAQKRIFFGPTYYDGSGGRVKGWVNHSLPDERKDDGSCGWRETSCKYNDGYYDTYPQDGDLFIERQHPISAGGRSPYKWVYGFYYRHNGKWLRSDGDKLNYVGDNSLLGSEYDYDHDNNAWARKIRTGETSEVKNPSLKILPKYWALYYIIKTSN